MELLIVVVVIAILAAVIVVSYGRVTDAAAKSMVKSESAQVSKSIASYVNLNPGQAPADLQSLGFKNTDDMKYEYTPGVNSWCATVTRGAISFRVSSVSMTPEEGLCSGHAGAVIAGPWTGLSSAEDGHTCGIMDSKAYCWGYNYHFQAGSTGSNKVKPTLVAGVLSGKQVTSISAGDSHTCAVADEKAYCWGKGDKGQVGYGGNVTYMPPAAVSAGGVLAGKRVTAVAAGIDHSCAVADGKAYCWGANNNGQLGDGTNIDSNVPVAVSVDGVMTGNVTDIDVRLASCAVADGKAYCWGSDGYGLLGNGGTSVNSNIPVAVDTSGVLSGKTVTSIVMGNANASVIANGLPYGWGYGPYGIGDGTGGTMHQSPVAIVATGALAGKTISHIAAGGYVTCAVASSLPYCWGDGGAGHLGNNSNASSPVPIAVDASGAMAGRPVQAVSSGTYHACALATGEIYCWGRNNQSQLGNGGGVDVWYPVKVLSP